MWPTNVARVSVVPNPSKETSNERPGNFQPAGCPHADRHADLHSLGLTVLTFLFTMTQVPLESVALKLFHGHREVRDHGHSVLHPGRQLPDPRRGGETDDQLRATSMVGHWYGGLGLAGVSPAPAVRGGVRFQPGDGGGHRLHPAAGDGQAGSPTVSGPASSRPPARSVS